METKDGSGSMPGMSSGAGNQASVNNMSSEAKAQAMNAAKPAAQSMQQAQNTSQERVGGSPSNSGTLQEKGATHTTETEKAGQTMQNHGVETNAAQSPDSKAEMQSSLANSAKNGQDTPRTDAAREQAKNAPESESESPSQSPER